MPGRKKTQLTTRRSGAPDRPVEVDDLRYQQKGGLASYNLNGEEVAYYAIGNVNNVDILDGFTLGNKPVSILGCSNRTHQSINLFRIENATGELKPVTTDTLFSDPDLVDDIYGFCFARDRQTGTAYCVINAKNGLVQQFRMVEKQGKIGLELVRSIQMDSQPEGMVADEELVFLYIGEEGRGIWKVAIDPRSTAGKTFLQDSDDNNPNISYDIEGLSI
ncbi:MAG: phytase [Saprospiraceae bacterium]|nr:phytase [Saprospiraceae bacterium]